MASGFDGITNQANIAFQRAFLAVEHRAPEPAKVCDGLTRKLTGPWNGAIGNDGFDETNGKGAIVLLESKPRDGSNIDNGKGKGDIDFRPSHL